MSIYKEPPPGMCIVPDSDDLTKVIKCFLKNLRDTCKTYILKLQFGKKLF